MTINNFVNLVLFVKNSIKEANSLIQLSFLFWSELNFVKLIRGKTDSQYDCTLLILWQIMDFIGAPIPEEAHQPIIRKNWYKNCMEMKEFGPGACPYCPLPRTRHGYQE